MTIKQAAYRAAQQFKVGRGRAWAFVNMQDEIIDAECMDQVRAAHYAGGSMTTAQIMEFREEFKQYIAKMGYV